MQRPFCEMARGLKPTALTAFNSSNGAAGFSLRALLVLGGSHHLIENAKQVFPHDLGNIPIAVTSFQKCLGDILVLACVLDSLDVDRIASPIGADSHEFSSTEALLFPTKAYSLGLRSCP